MIPLRDESGTFVLDFLVYLQKLLGPLPGTDLQHYVSVKSSSLMVFEIAGF